MAFKNFFQIRKWREYCRRFTDLIAYESKWFLLPFLIMVGKGKRGAEGEVPRKLLRPNLSMLMKRPFLPC